jgi:ADP-glucose pyrophosphorylase
MFANKKRVFQYLIYFFQAYLFNDYWEDIGTIKSFFEANLALAEQVCLTIK